jgi:hypothetical protein
VTTTTAAAPAPASATTVAGMDLLGKETTRLAFTGGGLSRGMAAVVLIPTGLLLLAVRGRRVRDRSE